MNVDGLIQWILKEKAGKWVIFLVILFTILSGIGLKNIEIASEYKIFFDKDDKDLTLLEEMQQIYTSTDNVFIMIKPLQGDVFNESTIQLVFHLTKELWQVPYVTRVDSLTNFPYSYADNDDIIVEEFIYDEEQINSERISYIKSSIPGERDLVDTLVTESGEYTGINVTTLLPGNNHKAEILEITSAVNELIAKYNIRYPSHEFYISGIVAMNGAFFNAAKNDFTTLIPLMMVFVLLASGLILGSIHAAGVIFIVVLLSFVGALGFSGWIGIKLSAPSISSPIIMFTVIIASSIHIITYVKRQILKGVLPLDAIFQSYNRNIKPIIFSHVTTIIGFLSLNMSDSPPFRDLGNIVALGVVFSLLMVLTIMPYLLLKINQSTSKRSVLTLFDHVDLLSNSVIRNKYSILIVFIPIFLVISYLSLSNELNDDLIKYFDESVAFRSDTEKVDEYFSGIYNIDYSLSTSSENGIFQNNFLIFVQDFEEWLIRQEKVITIGSPLHRIKDLNRLMHSGNDLYYQLPSNAVMAAQYFLFYEMSLPYGKDVGNYISFDKSSLKVTARLRNMSSKEVIGFEKLVDQWITEHKPLGIGIIHTSPAVIFSHIGESSTVSLLKGAFFAFLIISVVLMFAFRSIYIGVLSQIPNILPVSAAFGIWYLLSGELSMGLAGVSAMVIGIIVDDTVHFLYHYVNGIKGGLSPENSVRETLNKTMSAIVLSSTLLIIGFMLLSTSSFEKNAQMGLLTSITIFLALIFDLILLPAIVLVFLRGQKTKIVTYTESETVR